MTTPDYCAECGRDFVHDENTLSCWECYVEYCEVCAELLDNELRCPDCAFANAVWAE